MRSEPPSVAGGDHSTVAAPSPGIAPNVVGAEGGAGTVTSTVVWSWASMLVASPEIVAVDPAGVYDARMRESVPGNVCNTATPSASVTPAVGFANC